MKEILPCNFKARLLTLICLVTFAVTNTFAQTCINPRTIVPNSNPEQLIDLTCAGGNVAIATTTLGGTNGEPLLWEIISDTTGGAVFFSSGNANPLPAVLNGPVNSVIITTGPLAGQATVRLSYVNRPGLGTCSTSAVTKVVQVEGTPSVQTCFNDPGTITAVNFGTRVGDEAGLFNLPGACGNYTFTLNPGGATNNTGVFTGLAPGPYTLTITDCSGCSDVSPVINLVNPPEVQITAVCPDPINVNACFYANDAAALAAYNAWRTAFTYNGGTPPVEHTVTVTPPNPVISACGTSVTVTNRVVDICGQVDECSSTFVITSAPAVVPSKPADVVIPFCQVTTQESLAQQFAAWLAQFGATGGCDPQVQLSAHGDPGTCGGDPITVTATITDKCLATPIVVSATFEVVRPLAPFISERSDVRILACTTQAEIHTRWLDFLASVTAGSECGPLVVTPQPSGAEPDRCAGGDVLVTWVANPNCFPPLMRTARFIVDPAPEPQIQCVAGRDLDCNPVGLPDLPPTVTSLCAYVLTHEDGPVLGEPCAREQIRTWRVTTDCYPNGVTCTQRFTWKESTGPTLLCAPNETIACNTTPVFTPPTVSGGCAEVILSGPVITVVGNVHTATWTATDACGITSAPCSQSITVEQCLLNGCTLGYWKNHTQAWSCEGIQTCTLYGTVFTGAPANLANLTLLEVLNLKGNTNCENLGRQSVAALLNICEGLPYGIPTQGELITLVNTAFAENNCLNIGALLDGYNNEGGDNHCDVEFSPNDKTDQCNGAGARVKGVNKKVSNASGLESVKAYPNPFTNAFSLDVRPLTNPDQLHMSIYDMRGRSIEQIYFNPEETNSLQFGDGLPTGIYNVILNQATEVKTLRVIKQ